MCNFFQRLFFKVRDSFAERISYQIQYRQEAQFLRHSTFDNTTSGVSSKKDSGRELVVSLTTHGRRLFDTYLAIESIMQGSIKPDRIILWLSEEQKDTPLPITLQKQCKRGLDIRYVKDIGSYTKLIPALLAFPESDIVTIDDDIIYPYDTLELLVASHNQYPSAICANRIIRAFHQPDGSLASFLTWKQLCNDKSIDPCNFFEGLAGVLYPSGCFTPEVFNEEIFRTLCPTADDIWFNCMARLNHISIVPSNAHYSRFPLLVNETVQDVALWRINNRKKDCPHDKQLHAVLNKYGLSY